MIKRQLANGRTVTARRNGGIRKRCDCPRAQWVRCSHPWHANFSHEGTEYRVSLQKWAKKPADYVMLQGEAKTLFRSWSASIEGGHETPKAKAATMTLDAIATFYIEEYVEVPDRRKTAAAEMKRIVLSLCNATVDGARLGDLSASELTKAHIEAFRTGRRQAHEAGLQAREAIDVLRAAGDAVPDDLLRRAQRAAISSKSGRVATNRLLARLRHLFVWAIAEKGLLEASPFSKGGVSMIKLDAKAEGPRSRRLQDDEEPRLLAAAGPHLRACIEAALETGMRKGEILGLQWQHVRTSLALIDLPAHVTKTGVARHIVITPRLAVILDMAASSQRVALETDSSEALPGTLHPFGNEIGEAVQGFKTAWRLTCKRAGIDGLHFHDLRRESGSRLLETPGVSLTDVRDFLGHRDVSQTNTYLSSTALRLRDALAKRDAARTNLAQPPQTENADTMSALVTH